MCKNGRFFTSRISNFDFTHLCYRKIMKFSQCGLHMSRALQHQMPFYTDQLSSPKVVKERRWALNTSLLPHFVRHFAVWWEEEESFNNLIFCGAMIEMDTRVQLQLIRFRTGEQVHRFECASLYNTIELSPSPLAQSHITFGAQWTF